MFKLFLEFCYNKLDNAEILVYKVGSFMQLH
jgi:hypothetical protein